MSPKYYYHETFLWEPVYLHTCKRGPVSVYVCETESWWNTYFLLWFLTKKIERYYTRVLSPLPEPISSSVLLSAPPSQSVFALPFSESGFIFFFPISPNHLSWKWCIMELRDLYWKWQSLYCHLVVEF